MCNGRGASRRPSASRSARALRSWERPNASRASTGTVSGIPRRTRDGPPPWEPEAHRKRGVADHVGSALPASVSDRSRCAQLAPCEGSWRRTRRRVRRGVWWSRAGRSREG